MTPPTAYGPLSPRWFADDDFETAIGIVLGAARHGAVDVDEVLATVARIDDGDADSWVGEWVASAGGAWATAKEAESGGHRVSARSHYRRAGVYYVAALDVIARSGEPEREAPLRMRERACWDRAIALRDTPGERIAIPYAGASLTGYILRAPGSAARERRPLVVVVDGDRGTTTLTWIHGGAAAEARGYHWMTFDGPGRADLREHRLDWEAVLTPVADALLARADVDPDRLAVIGVGSGGFLVPRALAFEHRFAAAVADPGVVDLRGSRDHDGPSPFRLGPEVRAIVTPLLVTDSQSERRWPGQGRALYDLLGGPKELLRLSAGGATGTGPSALGSERDTRIFDWLDARLR